MANVDRRATESGIHAIEWKTDTPRCYRPVVARNSIRSRGKAVSPGDWAATLAGAVRSRRKALKLTQVDLANLADCGPVFVYAVENGKPSLRLDKLVAVLTVLGLRLSVEAGSGGVVFRVSP